MIRRIISGLLTLAFLGSSACVVTQDSPPPPPADGTLTLNWTIEESGSPGQCSLSNSASLSVAVYDGNGALYQTYNPPCSDMSTSIALPDGHYRRADTQLLDAAGHGRSTVLPVAEFDIISNTSLVIPIDFPADSFR